MDAWKDRDCSVQPMMIFLSSTRSKASLEPSSSSLARTRLSLNMHNLPIYVELENSLFSLCYYHWSTDNLLGYVTIGSNPPCHQVSYRNFQNISTYMYSKYQKSRQFLVKSLVVWKSKCDLKEILTPLCMFSPRCAMDQKWERYFFFLCFQHILSSRDSTRGRTS